MPTIFPDNQASPAESLTDIAGRFSLPGNIRKIEQLGSGNVNDTYLVITDSGNDNRAVLQKVNSHVFPQPRQVIENIATATRYMANRLAAPLPGRLDPWYLPGLIPTGEGVNYLVDSEDNTWRMLSHIPNSVSFDRIRDSDQGIKIGQALGFFHFLIEGMAPESLHNTLPGFHITPLYLKKLEGLRNPPPTSGSANHIQFCFDFIQRYRSWADALQNGEKSGQLKTRVIHGDPKISNILFDRQTDQPVGLIDLDTVKPGLIQFDIGDGLRSCCNPVGEDGTEIDAVHFDMDLCEAVLTGYATFGTAFIPPAELAWTFEAVRTIAFELGIRFFTDYLEGNVYFNIAYPEQNLVRALVQFRLAASIDSRQKQFDDLIRKFQKTFF